MEGMMTATDISAFGSGPALREFVRAAREIEVLLTDASQARTRQDAAAIAAWVWNARELLGPTGGWLRQTDSRLAVLKATPEFQEYRKQLCLLYQAVESLRQELVTHSQNLLQRQQQLIRTRSWASAVEKLAANEPE